MAEFMLFVEQTLLSFALCMGIRAKHTKIWVGGKGHKIPNQCCVILLKDFKGASTNFHFL